MKAKVDGCNLTIDLYELMESLSADEQRSLADALSVQDAVIGFVVQQILDGWTDFSSRAGRVCTAGPAPSHGLDWACREVAKRAGEVAKAEIERLESALKISEGECKKLRDAIDRKGR